MNLTKTFEESISHADELLILYDALLTKNQRAANSGNWTTKVFDSKLIPWPKRDGLWRSRGKNILIIGNNKAGIDLEAFNAAGLAVLLRSAMVLAMAAIDKLLHEAISLRFSSLAQAGELDKFVKLDLSTCYKIAQEARERRGKGGKIKKRPGHKIKSEVLRRIYQESYLSLKRLQEVSAACGKNKIFDKYAKTINSTPKELQDKWSHIYVRRNNIAHECDIVRKAKTKQIHFNHVSPSELQNDINFTKQFGKFLAKELS